MWKWVIWWTAGTGLWAQAPVYSAESLVNAASGRAGCWSPNTLGILYGADLSFVPASAPGAAATLPREWNRVTVYVGREPMPLLYVSATQVNFWIPASLPLQRTELRLARNGVTGPLVPIELTTACPELFTDAQGFVAASRADGGIVRPESPASPGETVVLYGTGFGPTVLRDGRLDRPSRADPLVDSDRVSVELDGRAVPAGSLWYAGLTPGFPGLFQINLTLPDWTPANAPVRISIGAASSTRPVRLAVSGNANAP